MIFFNVLSASDQRITLAELDERGVLNVVRTSGVSDPDLLSKLQFIHQLNVFDSMVAHDYTPLTDYLRFISDEHFDYTMDMAPLALGRLGSPQDFVDFSKAVVALPEEKRLSIKIWWGWTPRYTGYISGSLVQVIRLVEVLSRQVARLTIPIYLLNGRPHTLEDAIQAFERRGHRIAMPPAVAPNQEALFHVHKVANVHMMKLWKMITSVVEGEGVDVVWTRRFCNHTLHDWIRQFPRGIWADEERAKIINRLHQLPYSEAWDSALKTRWKNLGDEVSGLKILDTVMTYCSHHPEERERFLIQSLYDILSAFESDKDDDISCPNGIAERWILWMRDLIILDVALVDEIAKSIYEDPRYQEFDTLDETAPETILQWCRRYSVFPILAPWQVNISVKQALKSLQAVFEAEWCAAKPTKQDLIHRIFQDKKLNLMFTIFDDEKDLPRQNQIKKTADSAIIRLLH